VHGDLLWKRVFMDRCGIEIVTNRDLSFNRPNVVSLWWMDARGLGEELSRRSNWFRVWLVKKLVVEVVKN